VTELVGNAAIENAAIQYVIAYETAHGRAAVDTRGTGAPADVKSESRVIEVKAFGRSARGQDLWLEARQVAEAELNPDFWVYVVDNVRQGDPVKFGLRLLGGELLAKLVARKRVQTTYILPFPVGEYDAAPSA
jgi:hypothetical protein